MMASAVMVTPLSVSLAPMGTPIRSMISVWAGESPNIEANTSPAGVRVTAAPTPMVISRAAATPTVTVRRMERTFPLPLPSPAVRRSTMAFFSSRVKCSSSRD